MLFWTCEDVRKQGYDIHSKMHYNIPIIGDWQIKQYAKSKNIIIEDVQAFRVAKDDWVVVHKINPIVGYVEHAVLNF